MISPTALEVVRTLNDAGFEAFIVGGAVRDMLRGIPSDDCDITTNALPEQTVQVFSHCRVIPTGLKHGTVTVGYGDDMFEITTYRTDGTYSDGRHPDEVSFTRSLEEDLARRDFTVNAMAYHPVLGIIDPFGGQRDLQNRCLRCVGDPMKRFKEDALRIARLLRFAAVLTFDVNEQTAEAADSLCERLDLVAPERKRVELIKMLCGDNFKAVAMRFYRPLCRIIPALTPLYGFEQHNPHHEFTVYEHTMRAVDAAPNDLITRLAVLFHDIGKPSVFSFDESGVGHFYGHASVSEQIAKETMQALRFDNATIKAVLPLVHYHDSALTADKKLLRRRSRQLGDRVAVERLMNVKRADASACKHDSPPPCYDDVKLLLDDIERNNECINIASLAVSGHDLIKIGYQAGPIIGEILEGLLNEVMAENIENDREALLKLAETMWPHV